MQQLKPITVMYQGKQLVVCDYAQATQIISDLDEKLNMSKQDAAHWKGMVEHMTATMG